MNKFVLALFAAMTFVVATENTQAGLFDRCCKRPSILKKCCVTKCCPAPKPVCCPAPEPVCCPEPAPEPVCCPEPAPEPVCCPEPAPEPVCCPEPAPEPVCCPEPAPAPVCCPAPKPVCCKPVCCKPARKKCCLGSRLRGLMACRSNRCCR